MLDYLSNSVAQGLSRFHDNLLMARQNHPRSLSIQVVKPVQVITVKEPGQQDHEPCHWGTDDVQLRQVQGVWHN